MIIKEAFNIGDDNISAIPNSFEKFMSIKIGELKFIDSIQFLNTSLEKLTENLYKNDGDKYKKFKNTKREFKDDLELVCRKGFYPYEWFDDVKKFEHKGLPKRKDFYSQLCQKHITEEDYQHALNVYNKMGCKTFLDYHLFYLKTDILLLSDIFENFRKMSMECYDLDPANYISAASLAWDAMLLETNVKLDLLSDPGMLNLFEKGKRGGLCFVGSKRHVIANNKDIPETYDKTKPSNYILYLDANNLYGWAMVQFFFF